MTETPTPFGDAASLFRATWSAEPTLVASAPGRVNLIGEHTDYNDGYVLPMAVNRRTAVALGPAEEAGAAFVSTYHPTPVTVNGPPWAVQPDRLWVNYPLGVLAQIESRGKSPGPLRLAVASDVPVGAGLSSSAALEAATAMALVAFLGLQIPKAEMAVLCQKAEHEYAGVRCGIMDQMAGVLGEAIMLDCRTLDAQKVTLPDDVRVVVLDSGIPRGLTNSAYNERRNQCEWGVALMRSRWRKIRALRDVTPEMLEAAEPILPEVVYRRCRHVVSENVRVLEAVKALKRGDMEAMGRLLAGSHASMRDDYEISLPEMDRLVALSSAAQGCYGARLTGAGFGGAAVALVEAEHAEEFSISVISQYCAETGKPGKALLVSPDEGARVDYRAA